MHTLRLIPMMTFLLLACTLIQAQSTFDKYMSDPDDQTSAGTYYIYVGRFANTELWSFNKLNNLEKINSKMIADSSDVINGPYQTPSAAEAAWISMKMAGFQNAKLYQGAFEITPQQGQAETEIAVTEVEAPILVEATPAKSGLTITEYPNTLPSAEMVNPPVFPKPSDKKSGKQIVYSRPPTNEQSLQYDNPQLDQLVANAPAHHDTPIDRGISENNPDTFKPIVVPKTECKTQQVYFVQLSAMPDINGEPHEHLADRYNIYVFEDEKDHLFKILAGPFDKKEAANQAIKELKKTPKYAKVFLREMCYDIGQLNSPLTQNDKMFMQLTVLYAQK